VNTLSRVAVAMTLLVLLPAQALAQSAPAKPQVVVVQQPAPAAPAKPQVVVQTSSAPAAPAPAALPTPKLTLQLPAAANLGETLKVQVNLTGPDGAPINAAAIDLSTAATFLNTQSSVVVAHGVTDGAGNATVEWQPRSTGSLPFTAAFGGNSRFGHVTSNATLVVKGDSQLYQQQAGVVLPGLNAAPGSTAMATLTQPAPGLWPRVSGWPLVVVLAIVWSLYGRAVWNLFGIARGGEPETVTGGIR